MVGKGLGHSCLGTCTSHLDASLVCECAPVLALSPTAEAGHLPHFASEAASSVLTEVDTGADAPDDTMQTAKAETF